MNFLHFAILLFAVSVALLVVVSLVTAPPPIERIRGLTYATTVPADRDRSRASWSALDVVLSVVVVVAIVGILVYFSPWMPWVT